MVERDDERQYESEESGKRQAERQTRRGEVGDREVPELDEPRLSGASAAAADDTIDVEALAQRVRGKLGGRRRGSRTVRAEEASTRVHLRPAQRLLILDTWVRSKLPAREFADLFGLSQHTLYAWKKRFDEEGPAGLEDAQRGRPRGSRVSEAAKRAILLMKAQHPSWGQDRLHAMLMRTDGLSTSPGAIQRVLLENGYTVESEPTKPHEPKATRFESKTANVLWQTDLFTFTLKRENRRVWMVAYMDDHSRFIVGYGVYASSSGALVREVLEASIANFGAPKELLTDNGPQYHTWRGKSAFSELCERRGIKQIVAAPRHPQTLGKIERFWGTLWRDLLEGAIFRGLEDARVRIGHFIDYYNFQRTHTGIEGLVPADRYFDASSAVQATLRARVATNAIDLARHGAPRKSFYLTGRVGDQTIALHASGSRVVMTKEDGTREEVDLAHEGLRASEQEEAAMPVPAAVCGGESARIGAEVDEAESELAPPGSSPLEDALEVLSRGLEEEPDLPENDERDDDEGAAGALVVR